MWQVLGALVDLIHALLMAMWIVCLPLLFYHRWPRITRAYGAYAIVFVVLNQVSHSTLGECFLTSIARACWRHAMNSGAATPTSDDWFTVRLAEAIFRLTPSHESIKLASEALIVATAAGVLWSLRRLRGTDVAAGAVGRRRDGRAARAAG